MKRTAKFLCIAVIAFMSVPTSAQQVATIGMGDVTFSADENVDLTSSSELLNTLSRDINNALTQTRKFRVLDKSQVMAHLAKQGRNLEAYYAKQYIGNAIWQEGLDFILKVNVSEFGLAEALKDDRDGASGNIHIDFQLFGVADVTHDFKSSVTGRFPVNVIVGEKSATTGLLNNAIETLVEQLTDKIVSNIFPIQIVTIADHEDDEDEAYYGDITLNYGEGFLRTGDTVLMYSSETEEIIDESGRATAVDEQLATLKVISTNKRFSVAQLLKRLKPIDDDEYDVLLKRGQKGRLLLDRR